MFAPFKIRVGASAVALAIALATSSFSAQAALERVGPVSAAPSVGGFPSWYQDTTGIALEFCDPKSQAELAGGWCLLLPGDVNVVPEVFPTNFFDEHFFFAAGAAATAHLSDPVHGKALLVMAQEGAFATGVAPGEQITFSRIRMWLSPLPMAGTYRFIHPYGEELLSGAAGERIFFTDDVGVGCNGLFDCALRSRLGPFLVPSATVGGAEMAPLTAQNPTPDIDPAHFAGLFAPTPYPNTGKAYLGDPNRTGPVTGSALPNFIDSKGISRNHNIFRIEGPLGSGLGFDPVTGASVDWVETTDFQVMGRLYDGTMPGVAKTNRASYTRDASGQKLDVYVEGAAATAARYPAQAAPAKVAPTMTFFNAPCAGTVDAFGVVHAPFSAPLAAAVTVPPSVLTETQMLATGTSYWGQIRPAVLPSVVCVKNGNARDAAGNLLPVFTPKIVTDEVTVSQAYYDTATGSLTVTATSSDTTVPPVLQVAYNGFIGPLVGGQIVVPNVLVPPSTLVVESSALGVTEFQVVTAKPSGVVVAGAPVAVSESYTFAEDSPTQQLPILANDTPMTGGTVTLTSAPSFGTAVFNALTGMVAYTPRLNYNGTDSFTYTQTVGTQVSNFATVSLNITPVNDAPVAVNDSTSATVNVAAQINVMANDIDPDGNTDVVSAVLVGTSTPAGATITGGAGGTFTFLAPTQGTYTFKYSAKDAAGVLSANLGTVTVTVQAPQSVVFNKAAYTAKTRLLAATGIISPDPSPAIVPVTFFFVNNLGTVLGTVGTFDMAAGKLILNTTVGVAGLPAGTTRLLATTPAGGKTAFAISIK